MKEISYKDIDVEEMMELLHEINQMEYPVRISHGSETRETMEKILRQYQEILCNYKEAFFIQKEYTTICALMDELVTVYGDYTDGFYKNAYIGMDLIVGKYKDSFNKNILNCTSPREILYRSRTGESHISFSSDEMFHISYRHRALSSPQR